MAIRYLPGLPRTAELVVIGGGIVGAATAFHAARAGLRPLVLERRPALCSLTTAVAAGGDRPAGLRPRGPPAGLPLVDDHRRGRGAAAAAGGAAARLGGRRRRPARRRRGAAGVPVPGEGGRAGPLPRGGRSWSCPRSRRCRPTPR